MNQHCAVLQERHLQPKTIRPFDDSGDLRFNDLIAYAGTDVVSDFVLRPVGWHASDSISRRALRRSSAVYLIHDALGLIDRPIYREHFRRRRTIRVLQLFNRRGLRISASSAQVGTFPGPPAYSLSVILQPYGSRAWLVGKHREGPPGDR